MTSSTNARIPVVIVTGFLGSGKTTFLNELLATQPGEAQALGVIVNELGDVGIDGSLLPEGTREIELPGGCVCCSLDEDLEKTLLELRSGRPNLRRVIVETTGIADPLPILWTLRGEGLEPHFRAEAVVTVVDGLHYLDLLPTHVVIESQVHEADLLVVSKLDVPASGSHAAQIPSTLVAALTRQNPGAVILASHRDERAQRLWRILSGGDVAPRDRALGDTPPVPRHDHMDQRAYSLPGVYDPDEVEDILAALPPGIVRIKGILRVIDPDKPTSPPIWAAVHRVGPRVSWDSLPPGQHDTTGRIVALGRDLGDLDLGLMLASAKKG